MSVKQDEQKNLNDNFLRAQYQAKQLVTHEKEKQGKNIQKIFDLFKKTNKKNLFEQTPTTVVNCDKHIGANVDFSYYKLNFDYLKKSGLHLEEITTDVVASNSSTKIMYSEYYVDRRNTCIIWIKYHFKHIRIYADNGKTDVMTFAFVNTKAEIYYYDDIAGCKPLKKCKVDMDISYAQELIKGKSFEVKPYKNRTYEIVSEENYQKFEEKSISDIHLLPQRLLDILLSQYKNDFIPSKSQIMIETKSLDVSESSTVQTEIKVNYEYSGVIQTTEKLLKYEISLYFKEFPTIKVTAYFYLTQAEKNQKFVITDEWLEKITLTDTNEKIEKSSNYCENFYKKYLISKSELGSRDSNLKDLAKIFYQNMRVTNSFVEFPKLKDTYKGIYVERFVINDNGIQYYFPFGEQISELKLEYDENHLKQSVKYAVLYEDELYLLEIYAYYLSYKYTDSSITLRFPAFVIDDININVFKPTLQTDVDIFVDSSSCQKLQKKFTEFNSFNYRKDIQRDEPINDRNWQKIFPDFIIQTAGKREKYKVVSIDSNMIYDKILNCITTLRTESSSFSFSKDYPFGFGDEDDFDRKKFPLVSNGLEYGAYFDDGINILSVNIPMKEKCDYSYSSGDDLLKVTFDDSTPYFKTTFYTLLENCNKFFHRDSEISNTSHQAVGKYPFWDECIKFLLHITEKNISK